MARGKELLRFEGHTALLWCVALSPDGRQSLSCGDDGTVRPWEPPKQISEFWGGATLTRYTEEAKHGLT